MLLDLTAAAFFSSFAIILGLILIIDSRMYMYSASESSSTRRNRKGEMKRQSSQKHLGTYISTVCWVSC
ncbi:hypothetical protein RCO48_20680 [Peribacillus frigoritolerans]|nr:hypothetical protein [Peribacillus frigoritolerans]